MAKQTIVVPDIGGAEGVEVIELSVKPGDKVEVEQSLLVLESDKASMDVPSPHAGTLVKFLVKEGDSVSEGTPIAEIETASSSADSRTTAEEKPEPRQEAAPAPAPQSPKPSANVSGEEKTIQVPDIGSDEMVDVIEVAVNAGDQVGEGDTLITLESDKATMDVPAPEACTIVKMLLKEGDKAGTGIDLAVVKAAGGSAASAVAAQQQPASVSAPSAPVSAPPQPAASGSSEMTATVPDIGSDDMVDVIEVSIKEGDEIAEGDTMITLESDKATMDVPAPAAGTVVKMLIKEGEKAGTGTPVAILKVAGGNAATASVAVPETPAKAAPAAATAPARAIAPVESADQKQAESVGSADVYAGPAVRLFARELGVDLRKVSGSGPKGRIQKEDVNNYVKSTLKAVAGGAPAIASAGAGIPQIPVVDFSKFGDVEKVKMSKIQKLTAANMHRAWLNVPHVTQFDDADITDLEEFRKSLKAESEKRGVKVTPVGFIIKAAAAALAAVPEFNRSLAGDDEHYVQKHYFHIGMAVDTPNGLVVPVIRDVDKKGIWQVSADVTEMAGKARDGKLKANEMQGASFTISSLGANGGTGFTPIVNTPEAGILGVSRSDMKPVWDGKQFVPRLMLPLCLSYDHRLINGGDAGRFMTTLVKFLQDIRHLMM